MENKTAILKSVPRKDAELCDSCHYPVCLAEEEVDPGTSTQENSLQVGVGQWEGASLCWDPLPEV